jgi:hypothetical protein
MWQQDNWAQQALEVKKTNAKLTTHPNLPSEEAIPRSSLRQEEKMVDGGGWEKEACIRSTEKNLWVHQNSHLVKFLIYRTQIIGNC